MKRYQRLYENDLSSEVKATAAELKARYPQADFSLGDCGVLALYLAKKFGGSVSLVITEDEPDRALHVLYQNGFNYYDEQGLQYDDDVKRVYEDNYSEDSIQIVDGADKDEVLSMTEPNLSPEEVGEILA